MAVVLKALDRGAEAESMYRQAIRAGDEPARVDYDELRRKRPAAGIPSPEIRFDPADLPVAVRNGATGKKRLIETMIAGVAVLDFDGDGGRMFTFATAQARRTRCSGTTATAHSPM